MGRARKVGRMAKFRTWILKAVIVGLLLFFGLTALEVLLFRYMNPSVTTNGAWRWVRSRVATTSYHRMRQEWRPLEDISVNLQKAVLAAEDQRFLTHHGFDFVEMESAFRQAVRAGRIRGASTITMQAARSVFLWPDRTFLRKGLEAYYTILMELLWEKRRILEVYLNTVDWGPGIMGAEAASRSYFGVGAHQLTRSQAALMAAVLPNPHRWSPVRPGPHVLGRRDRIVRDMERVPYLPERHEE